MIYSVAPLKCRDQSPNSLLVHLLTPFNGQMSQMLFRGPAKQFLHISVVTTFNRCTLQSMLLIFYIKILCKNCSWLTCHPLLIPFFLPSSTPESGKPNTYSSASLWLAIWNSRKSVTGGFWEQSWWEGICIDAGSRLFFYFYLPGVLLWCLEMQ